MSDREAIARIVLDAIQNADSGERGDSGYLDRDHANDAADAILALSPPADDASITIKVEPGERSDWPQKSAEEISDIIRDAYMAGATDVHRYWAENPGEPPQSDPEFGEAAYDHMMSVGPLVMADPADDAGVER